MRLKFLGYTLIELVVYIALLSVVLLIVTTSLISIYQSFARARVESALANGGRVALETLVRGIRSATSTELASSTFGSHPGILDMHEKRFSLAGNALRLDEDSGYSIDITPSDIRVTNLIFYRSATATPSGDFEIIKIEISLEAGGGQYLKSKNFFGSAVLRGAY